MRRVVLQSGATIGLRAIVAAALGLWTTSTFVLAFFLDWTIALVVGAGIGLIAPRFVLTFLRNRRRKRFGDQFPEAIDIVVRSLRAGHPIAAAIRMAAREMPDPIGSEFGLTCDEITFGAQTAKALENLHLRVGEDELTYLAIAIKIQTETGGNLAEILGRLSKLMRDRAMLQLKVRSITAEGRLSAIFLSLAPFILFGVVTLLKPDYYFGVLDHPIAIPAGILGLVLLFIGNLTMYKMVHFKV